MESEVQRGKKVDYNTDSFCYKIQIHARENKLVKL